MTTVAALTAAMLSIAPSYQTRTGRIELHHVAVQLVGWGAGHAIEPEMLAAVAIRESTFNATARSTFAYRRGGALLVGHSIGLMGVRELPDEKRDLYNLSNNVSAGAALLAAAFKRCKGDVPRGLTAYNRGPGKNAKNCRPSKYSVEVLAFYGRLVAVTAAYAASGANP